MFRDIWYAVRSVRRWRFDAVTAALTLAIGIGAATSLFSFLRAVLSDAHIEDPWLWTAVIAHCGGIASIAVTLATYRIVKQDPWVTLRRI